MKSHLSIGKIVTDCFLFIKKTLLLFSLLPALTACAIETSSTSVLQSLSEPTTITHPDGNASSSSLARIKERGTLVVGTAITKPFEFHDPETGDLIGFDVDTAQYIADTLGVQLQWVEMPFANLIPAIQEQKIDMTIAAMYITPEREKLVDFADPYIDTGLILVIRPELQPQIKSVQDLRGLKVGVKIGATGAKLAEDLVAQGIAPEIKEYKSTLDSLLDLEVGRIDVVINDYLNTLAYIKDAQSNLKVVTGENGDVTFLSEAGLGIAIYKEDQELLAAVNTILATMKQDGSFDKLYQTWLAPSTGN